MCRKEPRNVSPALQMAQPSPATPDKATNYKKKEVLICFVLQHIAIYLFYRHFSLKVYSVELLNDSFNSMSTLCIDIRAVFALSIN